MWIVHIQGFPYIPKCLIIPHLVNDLNFGKRCHSIPHTVQSLHHYGYNYLQLVLNWFWLNFISGPWCKIAQRWLWCCCMKICVWSQVFKITRKLFFSQSDSRILDLRLILFFCFRIERNFNTTGTSHPIEIYCNE